MGQRRQGNSFTLPIFLAEWIYVLVVYKKTGFYYKSIYICFGMTITAKCLSRLILGLKESFCFKMVKTWNVGRNGISGMLANA